MISPTSSTTMRQPGRARWFPGKRGLVALLAGLTIGVIATGAVALMRSDRAQETTVAEVQTVQVAPPPPVAAVVEPAPPPVLYLVATDEEASGLARMIAESDAIRNELRLPQITTDVLVVSSDAEAEWLIASTRDTNSIRAGIGLPEIQIFDLRRK